MPITRLDCHAISALVGAEAAKRLSRKIRGGTAGQKGIRYEVLFGAHRIARLIRKLINTREDAFVEWQSNGFIDDFAIRRDPRKSLKAYQLKNSPSASWESEIQDDFANQHAVSHEEGYEDIRLRLVCSNKSTAQTLEAHVPDKISGFSTAFYFPWDEAILNVVHENSWMADDFGYLSRYASPDSAQIADVVRVMMGAWETEAPAAKVSEIHRKARRTSPTIIRPLESDDEARVQLDPAFIATLSELPDFTYRVERGFFHWTAFGGTTTGTLSHDCFSDQFRGLQRHIVGLKPKSVEDIEGVLL